MGRFTEALTLESPPEPTTKRHELLVGLRASIQPDGEAASIAVQFTNIKPFNVHVPLLQAASIVNEMRAAAAGMIERQYLKLDRGAGYVLELCEAAQHPAVIQIMVDPITQDRLFLFQFDHDGPVSLRISALELPMMLAQLARAIARASN